MRWGIKRNSSIANPPSLFELRRVHLAMHPCSKPQGILAKANKNSILFLELFSSLWMSRSPLLFPSTFRIERSHNSNCFNLMYFAPPDFKYMHCQRIKGIKISFHIFSARITNQSEFLFYPFYDENPKSLLQVLSLYRLFQPFC
jgi:hypothetical protein